MKKSFEIQNQKNFINKLMDLGSVGEVAKKIGVNHSMVSNWINGVHYAESENIEKILNAFNLKPEELGVVEVKTEVAGDDIGSTIKRLMVEKKSDKKI